MPTTLATNIRQKANIARTSWRDPKKSDYYDRYGGGVTFSGGEPLLQASYLTETMDQIQDIHCAIETSGYRILKTANLIVINMI